MLGNGTEMTGKGQGNEIQNEVKWCQFRQLVNKDTSKDNIYGQSNNFLIKQLN